MTIPTFLMNWLFPSIPQSVWIALLGFIGAMLGATFSQWGISRQLKQDRQQRQLEREMSMRRDVYLSAIDSIALMQESLAGYGRLDISDKDLSGMTKGIGGPISKVYLVGQFETVKAITSVYEAYATAVLRLGEKRMFATLETARLSEAKANLDQSLQKWSQAATAMHVAVQSGNQDVMASSNAELTEANRILKEHQTAMATAQRAAVTAQIGLIKEVSQATLEFERNTTAAVLPVRRELHFDIDEESFARMSEEVRSRMRTHLEEWLERLSKIADSAASNEPS